MCRSYETCTVRIKFNDAAPAAYSAVGPSDGSTTAIFITNSARFVSNVKHASRIIIEVEFYENGRQQIVFDTNGLEWPRP